MILDNETMFADKLAFGGTPETLDLGVVRPGPGKPLKCFFIAHAELTGVTSIEVLDAAAAPADEALMTIATDGVPPVLGELYEFELPSDTLQFVTVALGGTASAGNFSCGIVLPGNQTNL